MSAFQRRRPPAVPAGHDDARELARLVGECAAASIGRSALALRLSRLPAGRAQPHHLRLARDALNPLTTADRARLFELDNHDLVVVWRGEAAAAVQACRRTIDHLFADEAADPGEASPAAGLMLLMALPGDTRILLGVVEESLTGAPQAAAQVGGPATPPLDLGRLDALEACLHQADLARFARRRPVCEAGPDGSLATAWEKRFLSVDELAAALLPDRSARADPWLFARLTRTLDRRMLALLAHPEELRDAGPFSLNLNAASILSPEFLRFDAALPARLRGAVILELLPADVMADTATFLFAREFARVRGYALLLRGLNPLLLRMFAGQAGGAEWLELRWNPDLAAAEAVPAGTDPARIVLGRADSAVAIAWARSRGIGRLRGAAAQPTSRRPSPQPPRPAQARVIPVDGALRLPSRNIALGEALPAA